MAELLVFAHNHQNDPLNKNISLEQVSLLPKPYDLIVWKPDGWAWGDQELTHNWFRIILCDSFTDSDLNSFLSPLPASKSNHQFALFRAFYIDFTAFPTVISHFHQKRTVPKFQVPVNLQVWPKKVARTPITNPNFVGEPPDIIG